MICALHNTSTKCPPRTRASHTDTRSRSRGRRSLYPTHGPNMPMRATEAGLQPHANSHSSLISRRGGVYLAATISTCAGVVLTVALASASLVLSDESPRHMQPSEKHEQPSLMPQ